MPSTRMHETPTLDDHLGAHWDVCLEWKRAALLQHVIEAVKTLVTDVNLVIQRRHVDDDGIEQANQVIIQSMDSSHVSLVRAVIGESSMYTFAVAACDESTSVSIGINLNQWSKVIACADDDDRIVMLYSFQGRRNAHGTTNSGNEVIHLHMYSLRPCDAAATPCILAVDRTRGQRVVPYRRYGDSVSPIKEKYFTLQTVFVDDPAIGVPPHQPACSIQMPSRVLWDITNDLSRFADTMDICIVRNGKEMQDDGYTVVFSSTYGAEAGGRHELRSRHGAMEDTAAPEGDGVVSVTVEDQSLLRPWMDHQLPDSSRQSDGTSTRYTQNGMMAETLVSLSFATRYLKTFALAHEVSDTVVLHLRDDAPIQVLYGDASDAPERPFSVSYYLAPKIEE